MDPAPLRKPFRVLCPVTGPQLKEVVRQVSEPAELQRLQARPPVRISYPHDAARDDQAAEGFRMPEGEVGRVNAASRDADHMERPEFQRAREPGEVVGAAARRPWRCRRRAVMSSSRVADHAIAGLGEGRLLTRPAETRPRPGMKQHNRRPVASSVPVPQLPARYCCLALTDFGHYGNVPTVTRVRHYPRHQGSAPA
jgi:hypothetical protein